MTLQELLDELRQNVLRDVSSLVAGGLNPQDQLWSDETLARYINDAYRRFARRTLTIRDGATPQATQVTLRTGVDTYALHQSVLAVISLRYNTDVADLPRSSHSSINSIVPDDPLWWDVNQLGSMSPGRPITYETDEQVTAGPDTQVNLRVFPVPSATENGTICYLRVARLPLQDLSLNNMQAELEIPRDYHLDILDWAAYRALSNHEIDGGDGSAAKDHKDKFEALLKEVEQEAKRKMFARTQFQTGAGAWGWQK